MKGVYFQINIVNWVPILPYSVKVVCNASIDELWISSNLKIEEVQLALTE